MQALPHDDGPHRTDRRAVAACETGRMIDFGQAAAVSEDRFVGTAIDADAAALAVSLIHMDPLGADVRDI